MKKVLSIAALALAASLPSFAAVAPAPAPQTAQEKQAARDATREKLRALLEKVGARKGVDTTFRQSDKQPYNFIGVMKTGLANCDSLEIVLSVTNDSTIGLRVYPHYGSGYVNIDKARNAAGLMRKLLNLSHHNFLYFGADDSGDVFAGYTVTLESGFPEEAMTVVILSIRAIDQFVGEMRPMIDGTPAPAK